MTPIPTASLRRARLFGLMIPLAVAIGLAVLIMAPNLIVRVNGGAGGPGQALSASGDDAAQRATATVESPQIVR